VSTSTHWHFTFGLLSLDPWAAEFGRPAEFCPLAENLPKKNLARPTVAFPHRCRKKISPVKLNAFLITSSAQNNSAIQRWLDKQFKATTSVCNTNCIFCTSLAICCVPCTVFMAALQNRAGHYIFALWFLLSSSFYGRPMEQGRPSYFCMVSSVFFLLCYGCPA